MRRASHATSDILPKPCHRLKPNQTAKNELFWTRRQCCWNLHTWGAMHKDATWKWDAESSKRSFVEQRPLDSLAQSKLCVLQTAYIHPVHCSASYVCSALLQVEHGRSSGSFDSYRLDVTVRVIAKNTSTSDMIGFRNHKNGQRQGEVTSSASLMELGSVSQSTHTKPQWRAVLFARHVNTCSNHRKAGPE